MIAESACVLMSLGWGDIMRSALAMCSSPMILIPAYGASYDTPQEIQKAWESGKDFHMYGYSGYCSVRNLDALRNECSTLTIVDVRSKAQYSVEL